MCSCWASVLWCMCILVSTPWWIFMCWGFILEWRSRCWVPKPWWMCRCWAPLAWWMCLLSSSTLVNVYMLGSVPWWMCRCWLRHYGECVGVGLLYHGECEGVGFEKVYWYIYKTSWDKTSKATKRPNYKRSQVERSSYKCLNYKTS